MQILGHFCLLVVVCSVLELYKGISQALWGLFLMDSASCLKVLTQRSGYSGGLFAFGWFSPAFNVLWLFLMFCLGLRFLQYNWHGKGLVQFLSDIRGKSRDAKNGFCPKKDFDELRDSKILSCEASSLNLVKISQERNKDGSLVGKEVVNNPTKVDVSDDDCDNESFDVSDDDCDNESYSVEDEEFDVMALRRLVKIERLKANMAYAELEEERMASASAADEAMAMILRLQNEKSSMEIEANQYRKLAEQKQEYHQEVINSLQWDIMKLESEKSELEGCLTLYREKLNQYMKSEEMDQFEGFGAGLSIFHSTIEVGIEDVPSSSP